jgi:hypothetical protein
MTRLNFGSSRWFAAAAVRLIFLAGLLGTSSSSALAFDYALTFAFQEAANLPVNPSSILVQSPSFIDVPAGAVLSVHLLRGDTLIATSKLTFGQAFRNESLIPPVPVASFLPLNTANTTGEPLAAAQLEAGKADLTLLAQAPTQYRFLWDLSAGIMGTPGRAVVTGLPAPFFGDLKLCAVSAAKALGDQKPGSLLFFNRFTSSASNSLRENTLLSLTNTNLSASTFVRLFLVSNATCEINELTLCLAAQQTTSVYLSDVDPGTTGYIIAIATDGAGRPNYFNWLIGQAVVKQPTAAGSATAILGAYTVTKRREGVVAADGNNDAEMIFDDVNYDRLPAQLAFDSVPSQQNGANSTQLSIFRPAPNLSGGTVNAIIQITGAGRDSQNQVVTSTGSVGLNCFAQPNASSLRLSPININTLLPAGTTAWFTASTDDLQPLLGVLINTGEFNGGIAARALSYSAEYRIKVPVRTLNCP